MNPTALRRLSLALLTTAAVASAGCGSKCGPTNCGGCCSATGVCEAPSNNACGLNGAACSSCLAAQACLNGICSLEVAGSSSGTTTSLNHTSSTVSSNGSSSESGSSGTATTVTSGGTTNSGSHSSGSSGTSQTSSTATSNTSSGGTTTSSSTNSVTTSTGTTTSQTSTGTTASSSTSTSSTSSSSSTSQGTSTSSGTSSTTSSGLPICNVCTLNQQCASGYCNTGTGTGFCDTAQSCNTAGQSCLPYACGSGGSCLCPTGTTSSSSSGSTSTVGQNGADVCGSSAPSLQVGQPVTGTTQGFANNYEALGNPTDTCFPSLLTCEGPDVAYSFTPPSSGTYTFTVTPDATFDVALVVFQGTCQEPIVSCVLGADANAQGVQETGSVALTGGTPYFVVVDGFYQDGGLDGVDYGTYTLEVTTPPACVTSDLGLTGPGSSTQVSGDTSSATQTYTSACSQLVTTNFVAYSFTTTATADFTATAGTTNAAYQPMLSLGTGCGSSFGEQNCSAATTTSASLTILSLPAGPHTLVVGGAGTFLSGTSGPYTLDVSLTAPTPPPSNNTCNGATPITLSNRPDGGMFASIPVTNLGALNTNIGSLDGGCAGSGRGGSVVYSVDFPSAVQGLTATVFPGADGGLNYPEVSIQQPCYENNDGGINPDELVCANDTTDTAVTVSTPSLRSGTYFIWVGEINTGTPGSGTLQLSVP